MHPRTTKPVESPFGAVWLPTSAAQRHQKAADAPAMLLRKLPPVTETKFDRVSALGLLNAVGVGGIFVSGVLQPSELAEERIAA